MTKIRQNRGQQGDLAVLSVLSILLQLCLISVGSSSSHRRSHRERHQEPRFLKSKPVNVTVRVGERAVLPCTVEHLGTKQVSWNRYKERHFLTIGDLTWVRDSNIEIDHRARSADLQRQHNKHISHWNLVITGVQHRDAGLYECQIISTKKRSRLIRLKVIDPPKLEPAIVIRGKEYVEMGEPITLTCNATGGRLIPEEMDWFKDGDLVVSEKYKGIVITKYRSLESQALISELIIDRARSVHSGTYICRSSEDKIDSMEVTVLVANSSNVKRGSGSREISQIGLLNHAIAMTTATPILMLPSILSFIFVSWRVS